MLNCGNQREINSRLVRFSTLMVYRKIDLQHDTSYRRWASLGVQITSPKVAVQGQSYPSKSEDIANMTPIQ